MNADQISYYECVCSRMFGRMFSTLKANMPSLKQRCSTLPSCSNDFDISNSNSSGSDAMAHRKISLLMNVNNLVNTVPWQSFGET